MVVRDRGGAIVVRDGHTEGDRVGSELGLGFELGLDPYPIPLPLPLACTASKRSSSSFGSLMSSAIIA